MERSMETDQKLKIELLYDPVILLLGIYPKECKTGYNRDICTPDVHHSTIHINKAWETAQVPYN
jgi:hypothetical protein